MLTMLQALSEGRDHFKSDAWLFGKNPAFTHTFTHQNLEFNLKVVGGKITDCRIYSDSLYPDLIFSLEQSLLGKLYTSEEEIIKTAEKCVKPST